jgi:copper transport protein
MRLEALEKICQARRLGVGALVLGALAIGLTVTADGASAHGVQVASDPPPNAQLTEPPDTISASFSEPIEPSVTTIHLWDTTPKELPLSDIEFPAGRTAITAHVPDDLPSGIYTVIWRNLSTVDGHTWSGSFPFTVLGPGGQVPSGAVPESLQRLAQAPSQNPSTLESAARWVVLLGSAIMLGGTSYVLFVAYPAARGLASETKLRGLSSTVLAVTAAIGAFLVLEGSLLQLVVQADRLGGLGRVDELLVDTRLGHYLLARQGLLLIALLAIGLVWRGTSGRAAGFGLGVLLAASLGVLLTQSLVSHAAASDGPLWTTSIDVLHLLTAALWVGSLTHIGLAMPRWLDEVRGVPRTLFAAESFRRFSLLAAVSVVVLMASGVLSALVQFTSWDELWSTTYGWSLVGKMAAMLPLLVVAGLNAFILQPRVVAAGLHLAGAEADELGGTTADAVGRLQRLLANTIRAEAVLGVVVLIAVGVLIQLEPPRAAAEAAQQTANLAGQRPVNDRGYVLKTAELEGLILSLRIEPAQLGENTFELGLGSGFGNIGEVLETRLEFDHADAGEGGSRLPLPLSGSARYSARGTNLSLPGEWTVIANVRRRDEDDTRATFKIPIAAPAAAGSPAAETEDESIWRWPFEGARSAAAIAVLAATGAGAAGWGAWRVVRRRA